MGQASLRSPRNRTLFAAAVTFVLAICFTGSNGWWYVSSYGVPWWDKPPSIAGKGFSTVFLALTVAVADRRRSASITASPTVDPRTPPASAGGRPRR